MAAGRTRSPAGRRRAGDQELPHRPDRPADHAVRAEPEHPAGTRLAGGAAWDQREPAAAGAPYLAIWIAITLARLLFAYEAQHSAGFARALGGFLLSNRISPAALADAITFLGFMMLVVQRGTLAARSYLPALAQ